VIRGGRLPSQASEWVPLLLASEGEGSRESIGDVNMAQSRTQPNASKLAIIIQQGEVLDFIDGVTQRNETPEEYVRQEIANRSYGSIATKRRTSRWSLLSELAAGSPVPI
jgi:hypothetical protein